MIKVEDQQVSLHGTNEELQDELEHLLLAMTSNKELLVVASNACEHVTKLLLAKGDI